MVRYLYVQQASVPAPFIHVMLRRPDGATTVEEIAALVDSGADRTVIPSRFVSGLGLVQMGQLTIAGFGGQISQSPTYLVEVTIRKAKPVVVVALASEGESYVLLGRDVLNHFRVVLDGPQLVVEIEG
jgi:predicted aspartyl protease